MSIEIPKIRKILYCTDLSDNSHRALRYAMSIAGMAGAEVYIIHILERLSEDAVITLQAFMQDTSKREEAIHGRLRLTTEQLQKRQDAFWGGVQEKDRVLRDRIKSVEVIESFPADTILQKSRELACDMIVLGSHDRGTHHNFLGSVTKSVLRRTMIPTLVVPVPH